MTASTPARTYFFSGKTETNNNAWTEFDGTITVPRSESPAETIERIRAHKVAELGASKVVLLAFNEVLL